jgi:uncharacterized protein YukE
MTFFMMIPTDVMNVQAGIKQQQQIASQLLDTIKGYIPKVQAVWVGQDATEFGNDVMRKLVPAMIELIAAIGGMNLNLSKGMEIVNQADSQVKGLASGLSDLFGQI